MIFVLSFHRSGTQSTHEFLKNAGYKAIHNPSGRSKLDFQHEWLNRETDLEYIFQNIIQHISPNFNAVSDNPMAALYEQAFDQYSNAKFILGIRDADAWVKSVRRHIGQRELVPAEKVQYWKYLDSQPRYLCEISDQTLLDLYLHQQKEVEEFFAKKSALQQLCIINFDEDDVSIGAKLSEFLTVPFQAMPKIDKKS
jgi:hypothetical protein